VYSSDLHDRRRRAHLSSIRSEAISHERTQNRPHMTTYSVPPEDHEGHSPEASPRLPGESGERIVLADLDNPVHARAVVDLLDAYARDEMGGGAALPASTRDNLVSELRKRPHTLAILAFVDGEPAGLAICVEGFSTFACKPLLNVHDMMVAAKFRGRGL